MHSFLTGLLADDSWANQYTDTGKYLVLLVLLVMAFILGNVWRASQQGKRGKDLFIRRIPGLNAIDEAVGRATEMGRPVMMVPGIGSNVDGVVMQALKIFAYVSRMAANFGNPILICCAGAPVFTVGQEMIRDVYNKEGLSERWDPDSVRFISDRQFAFAAGVSGLMLREKVAATFLLGDFFAESLIFAETANAIGAIQVAGSTQNTQTPFFIAACDYVLIADEFYAAGAYLAREPILVGSLIGVDWCKILVIASCFFGMCLNTAEMGVLHPGQVSETLQDGVPTKVDPPREALKSDTLMFHLFHAGEDPSLEKELTREKYPDAESPQPDDKVTNW
jgi:hypothetical protein